MKIGMNLLLYTTAPDEKMFPIGEKLKAMGYDGLEWPLLTCSRAMAESIGKFNKSAGLEATTVHVFGEGQNPISDDKKERDTALDVIAERLELSATLGAKLMCGPLVQPLGHFTGKGPTETEWLRCVEFHQRAAEIAERVGVTIVIEYLNRFEIYFLNTADAAARLCAQVNHPRVQTMVDTFHANIEEDGLREAVLAAKSHLAHVHISENNRGIPGASKCIQWDDFFGALREVKYDGWLTVEAFGQFLPDLAAAARIWRPIFKDPDVLSRQAIAFIKKQIGQA